MAFPHVALGNALLAQAGPRGYTMVCHHGLMDDRGGFSLDHMFGF